MTDAHDLVELREQLNRLLEEWMARTSAGEPAEGGEWTPRADAWELPDRIVLRVDLPGVSPADVELRVDGGELVLRGRRPRPEDPDPSALVRAERPWGTFVRRWALPDVIDRDGVRAVYRDGVLEITVPRRPADAARRVPVEKEKD